MRSKLFVVIASAAAVSLGACAGHAPSDGPQFPERPEGCDVALYDEAPNVPTSNIGRVSATCDASLTDDACTRVLKDEACALGADVVWGVTTKPTAGGAKKALSGRAAHTKQPAR